MTLIELGGMGAEPVSVAEAKAWCRIERNDEDALVGTLVKAAREAIERETRLILARRSFRVALDTVPTDRRIAMPRRPLVAVTAVTAYGPDGSARSFSSGSATIDRFLETAARVSEEVAAAAVNGLEIEFTAGFDAASVPEALKLATKQIVSATYEIRGAVSADLQPGVMPAAARDLISAYREIRL